MNVFGQEVSITPFNLGFVLGVVSFISIFYVESSLARNFLGFLMGAGFSPAFTSESSHSNRYFALSTALLAFTLMILAGFRWPLIIAFFILSLRAVGEADTRMTLEAVEKCKENNKEKGE